MNPLRALQQQGQSVWLDFIARGFVASGGLSKLVAHEGLSGVTSNPAIFEKAIAEGAEYDAALRTVEAEADLPVMALFERLAIEDLRHAADVLRVVYEQTNGGDGFVSLEVSPYLAVETEATIKEARRLWRDVDRSNLMIKVPATRQGLPAIRSLIAEGINVNVTLLFSQGTYEDVANAYIEGLEAFAGNGGDLRRLASVASFFVSRIDSAVDKALDRRIAEVNDPQGKDALAALKGKVAIANAKLAYRRYKGIFSSTRWQRLAALGARPQRLLWASTGVKNPSYRDVLYVEELIGPETVNTMPPATLEAFRHHGRVRATLEAEVAQAEHTLAALDRAKISLDEITTKLVVEGVELFVDAADKLLAAVADKRTTVLGSRLNRQVLALDSNLSGDLKKATEEWRADGRLRRLWHKDATLWTGQDEHRWLGWLDLIDAEARNIEGYRAAAERLRKERLTDVLLLGMGGSSLGAEVLEQSFGQRDGCPRLRILDSTDPAEIRAVVNSIDVERTLFIVASKSGSTLEPNILRDYFLELLKTTLGPDRAGERFIAITDPGSSMEREAQAERFRQIVAGDPSVGGRYSVLSAFGLFPASLAGIEVDGLLRSARLMQLSCAADVPPAANPGALLGLAMGVAARRGRDKITIAVSPKIAGFGAWVEQLIAESTGKHGRGLIPIANEPLGAPAAYGPDRLFVQLRLAGDTDKEQDAALSALEAAGHPVVRIDVVSIEALAQEFFRWEFAVAVAGAVLGINPFDQPDVEASKIKTRELTSAYERTGALPAEQPILTSDTIDVYADPANPKQLGSRLTVSDLKGWLKAHLQTLRQGDYFAVLAYVARSGDHIAALQRLRTLIRNARRVATCVGFGPRFLHSTGQAYKGGPNSGVFLQITADDAKDLAVPGHKFSFGVVKAAQARGDFEVLAERRRRVLRIHLKGGDVSSGLARLEAAVRQALE
ncbi:MAG: bifunctional transaldolase/phosoglucose isomerase [Xanthobacteraceae bacterium]|nr:bifunctional transaldolase/phosoglucose isomerase [Xanthobacteraceae bacterium]